MYAQGRQLLRVFSVDARLYKEEGPATKSVILSEQSESKDLRTTGTATHKSVRRSFAFGLRPALRMTCVLRIRRGAVVSDGAYCGTVSDRSLQEYAVRERKTLALPGKLCYDTGR